MKRILVATDLSQRSAAAVERALMLARTHGAVLRALHVIPLHHHVGRHLAAGVDMDAEHDRAAAQLAGLLSDSSVASDHVITQGRAFVQIIREARAFDADITVVGAHGAHFLREFLIGTTAERVVRKSERPVLVVKRRPTEAYRRVAVGIDFSEASRHALGIARRLAPAADISVVHIYDDWFEGPMRRSGATETELQQVHREVTVELHQELDRFLAAGGARPEPERRLLPGYPATTLTRAAEEAGADLLAVGARGRGTIQYALLGSTAEHVIRESPCDVLTVRDEPPRLELP